MTNTDDIDERILMSPDTNEWNLWFELTAKEPLTMAQIVETVQPGRLIDSVVAPVELPPGRYSVRLVIEHADDQASERSGGETP